MHPRNVIDASPAGEILSPDCGAPAPEIIYNGEMKFLAPVIKVPVNAAY